MKQIVTAQVAGKEVTFETGRIAKQAHGSVIVTCGSNIVMVTVVSSTRESTMDFFPLTVEFAEKFYATGKIPGGYFKREGRPTQEATLTARLIDRPMRPCFPEGYRQETQIVATVLSSDGTFPVDILASMGASAATHISDIPFNGPTAAAQVIRVDGKLIANPTREEVEKAELNITIAGTRNGILMVEGEANFITEAEALEALKFGHDSMMPALDAQEKLRELSGKEKRAFEPKQIDADLRTKVESDYTEAVKSALSITEKIERYAKIDEVAKEAVEKYTADIADKDEKSARQSDVKTLIGDIKYRVARDLVLDTGKRIDGRTTTDIRQISCEVDLLPRAHGSGLFTRGETQVIGVTTLGTPDDEQMIDALHGTEKKRFMLHYNFPPYSVGETGRMGGQSRREIGHGFLAERAIKAILPDYEKFPYTVRVVSEVTESNGSSSMGTVCSGCLSLLDAGVPIKGNVSGIAMGLIKEGDRFAVLSDILGDEDHLGDMDFKVAGTRTGITSLQMDIKIDSISFEIMEQALKQAFDGRNHILDKMEEVMDRPRGEISQYAPRIQTIQVKPDKVREVIGPGGKVIKDIIEKTGVKINIEDDGKVHIASTDPEASAKAIAMVEAIVAEAEVGKVYSGKIVKITDFGAFVEILPNNQGLLHISEIAHERIRSVSDVLNEGDQIDVKVLDVDRAGRIKLSRKALLEKTTH